MKTSSWTLALGHVLSRTVTSKLGSLSPGPFRRNSSRKSEKDRQAFKPTYSALYCTKDSTNSIAFLGRAQFSLLYIVTCRIHTFARTNHRSPARFDITLTFNDPRCVNIRYHIRKETHRRLDDKLKCLGRPALFIWSCPNVIVVESTFLRAVRSTQ